MRYHVFSDVVTAFIEARWRWTLIYCFLTYLLTWLAFSLVWWFILYTHGDLDPEHLPDSRNDDTRWTPCVNRIYGFTSIFLFIIEVHTTVGYGSRALTLECPATIPLMCIEGILGSIIQSFIIGIVFAKLTRPKNRAQTILFTKNAVINQRNRNFCLLFRVGDVRKSRIIGVKIQAYLIKYESRKGSLLDCNEQVKMDITVDDAEDVFFMFPACAVHIIDKNSPFYSMSALDLLNSKMEILVVFEGTIESTGQPVQARSSYISTEILWGHRFVPVVEYCKHNGYVIDYAKFDETRRVSSPLCSARELNALYENDPFHRD